MEPKYYLFQRGYCWFIEGLNVAALEVVCSSDLVFAWVKMLSEVAKVVYRLNVEETPCRSWEEEQMNNVCVWINEKFSSSFIPIRKLSAENSCW